MKRRIITRFLVLLAFLAGQLNAQNCYEKALEKGQKLLSKGKPEMAIQAWEKGKQCPNADVKALDKLIQEVSDNDLDGVPNDLDQCKFEYGSKTKAGCPCYDVHLRKGIDYYYENLSDKALEQFALAKQCDDSLGGQPIAVWESKIRQAPRPYPDLESMVILKGEEATEKAEFPGGEMEMLKFLFSQLRYPRFARENGVEGTVYIRFIVEADGQLTHHEIMRDVGAGLGQESLRVVKLFPNYKPAKVDGKPVRSQFNLPVRFRLE